DGSKIADGLKALSALPRELDKLISKVTNCCIGDVKGTKSRALLTLSGSYLAPIVSCATIAQVALATPTLTAKSLVGALSDQNLLPMNCERVVEGIANHVVKIKNDNNITEHHLTATKGIESISQNDILHELGQDVLESIGVELPAKTVA